MKQVTAIVLLLGMLGQTFSTFLVVLDFQVNKDYIASNLCVNRFKPAMKCEGKCYLCKRLKKEDKKDQENPERKAESKFESLQIDRIARLDAPVRPMTTRTYPWYAEGLRDLAPAACFHPPQG